MTLENDQFSKELALSDISYYTEYFNSINQCSFFINKHEDHLVEK